MSEIKQSSFNETPRIEAVGEAHLACVLLLDTSSSMEGEAISNLNKALNEFKEKVSKDPLAKKRVDVCVIEFNDDVNVIQDFVPVNAMKPVTLTSGGVTSMGKAINFAIDKVKERNRFYATLGTPVYRPWIFMITDGAPTDSIDLAIQRIHDEESKGSFGKLKFFAIGVDGYDQETLLSLSKRVIDLKNLDFEGVFDWLAKSMVTISVSRVDENVQLGDLPENAHVVPSDW